MWTKAVRSVKNRYRGLGVSARGDLEMMKIDHAIDRKVGE